jgi:metal-responsive CopG/Arc/MetJ family transcriptional regulator
MKQESPVSIRIPQPLLKKIDAMAKEDGRSRSNMILKLLQEAIGK